MLALQAYLQLRRRLLGRLLVEVGWVRLALLVPMLTAAVGRVLVLAARHPQGQWAVPIFLTVLLAAAHRQRADLRFLATSAPHFQQWLAVEYVGWALPVALVLAGFQDWAAAGLALALAPWAAWLPAVQESRSTRHRARSVFRSEAFEWVSGMRAGGIWAWPVLVAGAMWQHAAPMGPVLALVLWLFVMLPCYVIPEPATMLAIAARRPDDFLRRRLLLGLGYAALTGLSFLALLATGPAGIGAGIMVGLVWLGLVGLVILTKYAFYPHVLHIRTMQALVISVALLMFGDPVYPVLMLVAVGGLIWQSRRRLRTVLAPEAV